MSPAGRRAPGRGHGSLLPWGLLAGLLLGCPDADDRPSAEAATPSVVAASPDSEAFRRQAHARALAALRREAPAALRRLDPVAAAEVGGGPLRPPAFGARARAERREALERALREAEGIRPELLSPPDAMVLRVLQMGLRRGQQQLVRPPWRDDPRALVHAVEPYLDALERRLAAGRCDDGCGVEALGPALEAGLAELGAASEPTVAAAREDLAALRRRLPVWTEALPSTHAVVAAQPELEATLQRLEATLQAAAAALPTAEAVPWTRPVAPADAGAWKRRPPRWDAVQLRRFLEEEEAYGLEPSLLFARAEAAVIRLQAMIDRDAARVAPRPALPRPFDAAACEATWAPLQAWAAAQGEALVAALDCAAALRSLPAPAPSDEALVRHLLQHGVVEPTRRAQVEATGVDVALVRGRAAPLAQGLVLQIAIASGSGRPAVELHALREAHDAACLAAAAVWIHGGLGDVRDPDDALTPRLAAHGCGDVTALVNAALARPRAALQGLGFVLLGDGPADAAALDRYWWAPMGLVRDLALPPMVPAEVQPQVRIEELDAPSGGG